MEIRLAINGYGRVGQCVLRALYESGHRDTMRVVAVNDLADAPAVVYLTRFDTTHGRFRGTVSQNGSTMNVNGDEVRLFNRENPDDLPWRDLGVDLVLECSGSVSDRTSAEAHLRAGAGRVLFSHPADPGVDATVVYGVNHGLLKPEHRIVSAASCTSNCSVPVIHALHRALRIRHGTITTVHSAMNDQPAVDVSHHHDLRRSRSALQSIIPVDTGLALGIDRLLPELAGCFEAVAMRVPTINVSLMDLTLEVETPTCPEAVNGILREAGRGPLRQVMGYTEEPLASCDFNHDPHSAVVDGSQTRVSGRHLVKVLCWFDNEWAYANRMLDVTDVWMRTAETSHGVREAG